MSIIIRKAYSQDLSAIRLCIDEAYSGYVTRIGKKPASMDTDFELFIKDGLIWIIEIENKVIGLIVIIDKIDFFEIRSVAIFPEFQKRGFGRKLMSYAEELALKRNCRILRLYTNAALPELVNYYISLGYIEEKREFDHGFNRVFLVKELKKANLSGARDGEKSCHP